MAENAAARPSAHADAWERAWRRFDAKADLGEPVAALVIGAVVLATTGHLNDEFAYVLVGVIAVVVPFGRRLLSYAWARLTYNGRHALAEVDRLRRELADLAPVTVLRRPDTPALKVLRDELGFGRLLLRRCPSGAGVFAQATTVPDDVQEDEAAWRQRVVAALDRWPPHKGQFQGSVSVQGGFTASAPPFTQAVSARVDMLGEIIRQIEEFEAED